MEARLWPDVLLSRWFLLLVGAGLLAVALVQVTGRSTPARRLANLGLPVEGIPDAYLMLTKVSPDRGYLVDRRDSTVRRSRSGYPGKRWNLDRFGGASAPGTPDHWLLRSKRFGSIFFVPVEEVPDLSYPFYYAFVRERLDGPALPLVTWTQLFVNRVYSGLYLRVELPVDPRVKDGRTGWLRELLMVGGDGMTLVDTRFNSDGRLYAECVSNGIFPRPTEPPPALLWLARRAPGSRATFLLGNAEPFEVSLLPLPISLDDLYRKLHGAPLPPTLDERFDAWTAPLALDAAAAEPAFGDGDRERMEEELVAYRGALGTALLNHLALHGSAVTPPMLALLEDAPS